jgi:hypothetical protein
MTDFMTDETERRDALTSRLFEATIGTLDIYCTYLGNRLGLYHALAQHGPSAPTELADREVAAQLASQVQFRGNGPPRP